MKRRPSSGTRVPAGSVAAQALTAKAKKPATATATAAPSGLSPANAQAFAAYNAQRKAKGYAPLTQQQWMAKSGATAAVAARAGTPAVEQPNQSLTTGLTADQQATMFEKIQGAQATLQETDFANQDAQAQHDQALAQLNQARARQAQATTDDMIARGMLSSGTAAGALADVEVAASNQREALNQALLSTQLRNQAVRTNIMTQQLPGLATLAQRQMGENIANGDVPGSFQVRPGVAAQAAQAGTTGKALKAPAKKKAAPKLPGGGRPQSPMANPHPKLSGPGGY